MDGGCAGAGSGEEGGGGVEALDVQGWRGCGRPSLGLEKIDG